MSIETVRPARTRPRRVPPARSQASRAEDELSAEAIRALEEGRVDHATRRTFTMAEIKREFGIES